MKSIKDRIDSISDTSNADVYSFPTSAKIELTGKCTLNCTFCAQAMLRKNNLRQKFLSIDDFEKIIQFIQTIPTMKEIGLFYMGESALHPQLPYFCKRIKDLGYFQYLTTNGTIKDNIIKSLPYVDSLKISWNYKNVNDFVEKTRSNPDLYSIIIHNINEINSICQSQNKPLYVSTVLDSCKEDYFDALSNLKFAEHYWLPLQSNGGLNSNGLDGVVGQNDNRRSPIPCWSLFNSMYVDVDLNIRTCCYGHFDSHILYNIKDQPTFFFPSKLIAMRRQHLQHIIPDECRQCLSQTM